jgi:hypothetical protein
MLSVAIPGRHQPTAAGSSLDACQVAGDLLEKAQSEHMLDTGPPLALVDELETLLTHVDVLGSTAEANFQDPQAAQTMHAVA